MNKLAPRSWKKFPIVFLLFFFILNYITLPVTVEHFTWAEIIVTKRPTDFILNDKLIAT